VPVTSPGLEGTSTSTSMAGAGSNDGHVGLRQLNLRDLVEVWVLRSLDGGGGWLGRRLRVILRLGGLVRVIFRLHPRWTPNVGTK
jgi:hypothetical protein